MSQDLAGFPDHGTADLKGVRRIAVITVHPALINAFSAFGVARAAREQGVASVETIDLRDYAVDRHGSIDDAPYGGGDGMVMRPEPLAAAIRALQARNGGGATGQRLRVLVMSPAGRQFCQKDAARLAAMPDDLVLVCGRFGGIDQRFIDRFADEEISLGDFVMAGGEAAALAVTEAVLRLIPGVLGHKDSAAEDSFSDIFEGGLEYPLYTRPEVFEGQRVPDILLSGDHKAIRAWRLHEARQRTLRLRPDLMPEGSG